MAKKIPKYTDECRAGDDYLLPIIYKDKATGIPHVLTDYTIRAQLRERVTSTEITATLNCSSPDPANGAIHCELDSTITATLVPTNKPFQSYVFDVELTDPSGEVKTILDVTVKFSQGVTR